jgi:hypothetical protein
MMKKNKKKVDIGMIVAMYVLEVTTAVLFLTGFITTAIINQGVGFVLLICSLLLMYALGIVVGELSHGTRN